MFYLGVASNELHGGENGFSRGKSFPARAEEQRLLSVRPEHNPEKSKSENNPGRGDDCYCNCKQSQNHKFLRKIHRQLYSMSTSKAFTYFFFEDPELPKIFQLL